MSLGNDLKQNLAGKSIRATLVAASFFTLYETVVQMFTHACCHLTVLVIGPESSNADFNQTSKSPV